MAIVLASTALAAHVVTEPVFVAIVAMSLATSFVSNPAMFPRLVDYGLNPDSGFVKIGVDLDKLAPLLRNFVAHEDGVDRALRLA